MSAQKTILVAEDDSNDVYLLKLAFLKAGLDVHFEFVQDGEQLIDYLEARDRNRENPIPELLLLDIKMPKVNGFEALEWIRRQPGLKRLLIVMLTSSDEPRDIDRAYDLGVNSYLVKPCGMEHLIGIAEYLYNYWMNLNRRADYTLTRGRGTSPAEFRRAH
jgi:CheY-like chemotaxis protein